MKRAMLPVFVAASLLLACGGEKSTTTSTETSTAGAPPAATASQSTAAAATTASPQYDLQFIDAMTKHHQSAVEMATLASQRAAAPEIKQMATKMAADQQKEIAQLKAWRDQWFANAPASDGASIPGASSMNMDMSHLQSLQGHQFDMMFIDMMVPHHEGAITMSCDAHAKAEHAELKKFARDVIRAQEREISQLQQWKSSMKM